MSYSVFGLETGNSKTHVRRVAVVCVCVNFCFKENYTSVYGGRRVWPVVTASVPVTSY